MIEAYHTALHEDDVDASNVYRWERGGSQAFVHDIALGLPLEFHACDVLYADLPWADGYDEFHHRAGVKMALPYEKWLYRLNGTLALSGKPWLVAGGAAVLRGIGAEWVTRFRLNNSVAVMLGAGLPKFNFDEDETVLRKLAARFKCVGDFCAGYGRSARVFAQAGKQFIVSDVNPKCIGYIAQHAPAWMQGKLC